jgi:hypothetical protein
VGNQNGSRALLKQGAIDFSPAIRWKDCASSRLRTTGFGELEREGLIESTKSESTKSESTKSESSASAAAVAEPPDPEVADFLPFERPAIAFRESNPARISPAIAPESLPVSLPRISALPLRARMTFGPPPAAKAKPAAVTPVAKPASPSPVKAPVAAPPKPAPTVVAPKPVAAPPSARAAVPAPAPIQTKPVTAIPPAPKPAVVIAPKPAAPAPPQASPPQASPPQASPPQASPKSAIPAARTADPAPVPASAPGTLKPAAPPVARPAEASPTQAKSSHTPARAPVSSPRAQESAISTLEAPPAPVSKAPVSAPPAPSGRAPSAAPAVEPPPAARPKPDVDAPAPNPPARASQAPSFTNEPHLTLGADAESRSFLEKVPFPAKIGMGLLILFAAIYFAIGKPGDKPAGGQGVVVGEQGWSTEWASDTVGSRRGRQITLYRPSMGLADYQMQFSGQIESKAIGWVFRAGDTKNYYGMKIETLKPGAMAISHFAVVEGKEVSSSQRPLAVDSRPGAVYRVKLDVSGPRFTVAIGGEPVDFWTDNRLKTGAVGFMNEREERGATSSVQFSFPQGLK